MGICHVPGRTLPARRETNFGGEVNDSGFQIFHISRLVWYLVLAYASKERVDVSGIDAEQRVQGPVCSCHDRTFITEEEDAEDI